MILIQNLGLSASFTAKQQGSHTGKTKLGLYIVRGLAYGRSDCTALRLEDKVQYKEELSLSILRCPKMCAPDGML